MDERLVDADAPPPTELDRLVDRRDWRNQMHTGTRAVHRFGLAGVRVCLPTRATDMRRGMNGVACQVQEALHGRSACR
jgi:hypothetical protein